MTTASLPGLPEPSGAPIESAEPASRPLILLHGFGGYERGGSGQSFYYWGGRTDLEMVLRNRGFDVRTAFVGPVSSNWDRACEFYAYLKGGTVDYGERHAALHGHERFGRTYPGLYREWGEPGADGPRAIDIIAHSMGGQTARLLVHLLEHGDEEERRAGGEVSPLFQGGKRWVNALMTIATPHDGTTFVQGHDRFDDFVGLMLGQVAFFSRAAGDRRPPVDLHLDQWTRYQFALDSLPGGLPRELLEGARHDLCFFDLSVEGASRFNAQVPASPHVYYFSWATVKPGFFSVSAPYFFLSNLYLANSHRLPYRHPSVDARWSANDGVVNTVSMAGPSLGGRDSIVDYDGTPRRGVWNRLGTLPDTDHAEVVGVSLASGQRIAGRFVEDWYAEQARLLAGTGR